MSKNIRIRTEPNGGDNHVKIQLNQDFDFLEILSLKISQEDVYRSFYSDYGVVVGRVIMNSGVGVPNARISIFIPLTDEDSEDVKLSHIYPYSDISDLNSTGIRYNTLPNDAQGVCHTPVGTFPTKRELIDNDPLLEIYNKYYKYTTTTNKSGDFMLFGVPVGNYILNVDVDLSDIGIFSQRPYDFIEQGNPVKLFESPTKFKTGTNLNNLTQVKNRQVGVNVIPFWGLSNNKEVGISRVDVDLNYNITPQAIFMGSIFGDNEKNSVNKTCRPRKKLGKVCEMAEGGGSILMLRKTLYGDNERYDIEGGRVITDNGVWAYQIPMNLEYKITDEFGNLTPTDDTTKGIPTKARLRFKVKMDETGGESRLRARANYLIPHNPLVKSEVDYSFDESTSDLHFRDFYWNKIYTIKNHVARFQRNSNYENRNFIGFKDVDDCVGTKNPLPFNKLDSDFNPIYIVLCLIISIILTIMGVLNQIISIRFLGIRPFCWIGCLGLTCPSNSIRYTPKCKRCKNGGESSYSKALDCFQIVLAESLNVFEFDFYNDWLNGSLYSFLLKYKKKKNVDKFCGDGDGDGKNYLVNTNPPNGKFDDSENKSINGGVIAKYKDELFYKPITEHNQKFYATDIYNLGAVFNCDWQGAEKIHDKLIPTSYQLPPLTDDVEVGETTETTSIEPLLFKLSCTKVSANTVQSRSIRRICELGVGLDEDDDTTDNNDTTNGSIGDEDITDELLRRNLIKLNQSDLFNTSIDDIDAGFSGDEYNLYRNSVNKSEISQFFGNSFYFYFGAKPNNSAVELMNSKYFTTCTKTIKTVITITGVISDVTTFGGSQGSITISISGGAQISSFSWIKNGDTTNIISNEQNLINQKEGLYTLTVVDDNGITATKSFNITGIKLLDSNVVIRDTHVGANDGQINITSIYGGIGPYTITIIGSGINITQNNVESSYLLDNVGQGTYSITITDSDGIPQSTNEVVEVNPVTQLVLTVEKQIYPCGDNDNGVIQIKITGGISPYYINIDGPNGPYTELLNEGLEAGSYNVVVTDSEESNASATVNLTQLGELSLQRIPLINKLYLFNTQSGVIYTIEKNGNPLTTVNGNSNGSVDLGVLGGGTYIAYNEYGCVSEELTF